MLRVGLTGGLGSGKSTVAAMLAERGAQVLQADEIGREMMRPGQAMFTAIVDWFGTGVVRADGELDRAELARLAFTEGRVEELNAIVHPAVIARQAEMAEEIAGRDPEAVLVVESALIFETKYGETKYGETKSGETEYGETEYGEAKYGKAKYGETRYGETKYRETEYEREKCEGKGDDGGEGWRARFDRLILVMAPEEVKIARYVERARLGAAADPAQVAALEEEARRRLGRQIDDAAKAPMCDYVLTNGGSVAELEAQVDALWPVLLREARTRRRS